MYNIYFARAVDGMDADEILGLANQVTKELIVYQMLLVDPFVQVKHVRDTCTFEEKAREIVEGDLSILKSADAVLMDCSIPGRSYIGCICELVYAHLWQIPVVVYVGSSGNDERYWLQYHATRVCKSREEAIDFLVSFFKAEQEQ